MFGVCCELKAMWFDKIASCGADLIKWVLKFKKVKRSQNSYLQGLVFLKLTGTVI